MVQVSLGSRDAQTLALTEDGTVYSWGDGDFGKLGRGGSDGCNVPHVIDRLNGLGICQIECGAQFSLALTKSGQAWTWWVTTVSYFLSISGKGTVLIVRVMTFLMPARPDCPGKRP